MEEKQLPKLSDVIIKIKKQAEILEDPDLKNIDYIISSLTEDERTILIKGTISVIDILENIHTYINENDLKDIELYNKKELIRLRNWFSKTIFVILLPTFLLFLGFIYTIDDNKEYGITTIIDDIVKVLKVLFL